MAKETQAKACGRMALLPVVRDGSAVVLALDALQSVQGFLVDGEASGGGGLHVGGGKFRMVFLEAGAVEAGSGDGLPKHLVRSCQQRFFFAHHLLDFIFHAGDFGFQFFLHAFEFHQFFDLAFHVGVAHCLRLPFFSVKSWGLA